MPLPELPPGVRENILRQNWWGHDGRWYMFVAKAFGFEKANEMNMAINKSVGKMEIRNLMTLTGLNKEQLQSNLLDTLSTNLTLCAESVFDLKDIAEEGDNLVLRIEKCPAHSGTLNAGYLTDYKCACFKRADGWLEEIGLEGTSQIRKSLVKGDRFCEIVISPAG